MKKLSSVLLMIAGFCFCKSNFVTAQVNTQDSLALVALYNGTDGPHWDNHTNWLTTKPVSKWYRITVTNNRVVSISLPYNHLNGSIAPELGNLTMLSHLYLQGNILTGQIPSELGLTSLSSLILFSNQLSGNIPPELGNLTMLHHVDLRNNKLSGSIPAELAIHASIGYLNVSDNKLSGSIPPELGNLTRLNYLDLKNNKLSGSIPAELGKLANLDFLDVFNNQLSGNIPPEIGNLSKLNYLDLENNKLSGHISAELGKLANLRYLNLSDNQLSGNIPTALSNLRALQGLYLENNKLSGSIPTELGKLTKLGYLSLDHNQLSGNIPPGLFKFYGYPCYLYLDHNQLSGSIPPELGNPKFDILHLDNNQLSGKVIDFSWPYGTVYIQNNKFTFAGLLKHHYQLIYSPQANIPIHQNGNILSVYTGGSYQLTLDTFKWYKDGSLVATIIGDSIFTPTATGAYNVAVTNSVATQLTLYSDTINYTAGDNVIASKMNINSSILLYPNPAKTNATLSFNADGKYSIVVTDVSGKMLQTKTGIANKGINIIQLDVSNYATGVYLITITDEKNKKQTLRLSKE